MERATALRLTAVFVPRSGLVAFLAMVGFGAAFVLGFLGRLLWPKRDGRPTGAAAP